MASVQQFPGEVPAGAEVGVGAVAPIAIGPVLAGWEKGQPVYYADMLFPGGETRRMTWAKRRKGGDRPVKTEATRICNNLMAGFRARGLAVFRLYDEASFNGAVSRWRSKPTMNLAA